MQLICSTYRNYLYYLSLASIFIIILGISNFQHKTLLAFSPWLFILLHKSYSEKLWITIKNDKEICIASALLSIHIIISSHVNHSGTQNYLTALAILIWLPIKACIDANIEYDFKKTYIKLYATFLLAQTTILSTLIWHKFLIGIDRPLGVGHNVISGPLICILAISSFEMALKFAWIQKNALIKNISAGIAVIFLLGSTITNSRTALLCAAAGILFIITRHSPQIKKVNLFIALTATAAVLLFNENRIYEAFIDIQNYKNGWLYTSIGGRLEALAWASDNITKNLFFGISIENITAEFNSRYGSRHIAVEYLPHLHNDFLQLSMAFGFPAAILFGFLLYAIYKKKWATSTGFIVICLFVVSMFDSLTYNTEALVAFFAVIAVNLALQCDSKVRSA